MTQQLSPWVEGNYGWNFGEGGWNAGMDENLLKFSFLFDRNVDGVVSTLPAAVNGKAYFLTTDKRLYFTVNTTYFSCPTPKWFEFVVRGTGITYQFDGTNAVQVDSASGVDSRLDAVELSVASLGTASTKNTEFFATTARVDVVEANAQSTADSAVQVIGEYAAGLVLRNRNQGFRYLEDIYLPTASTVLPYTTTGAGAAEVSTFRSVGDAVLRSELSIISVRKYTGVPDGIASNQAGIEAAVQAAKVAGGDVWWPAGRYVSNANIPDFWSVRHTGPGILVASGADWEVEPDRSSVRSLYVSPAGVDTNDGLSAARPKTIQGALDGLSKYGPIAGWQKIVGSGGVYSGDVNIPIGLALNDNYLTFDFPSDPGVRGDPAAWPVGGAILDGTSLAGVGNYGFTVGAYNNVQINYLLIRDWYNTALANTSQVSRGLLVDKFANVYAYGCSFSGNGLSNIGINPCGRAVVTGGILDAARYGIDNTGGRLSMTATAGTYTTIKNALEYGLYQKHESSTVMDFTEFDNNGKHPAAASYGAAIFAYKSNASVDTRSCTFTRNNICFNLRGGFYAAHSDLPDVFGSGANENARIWLVKGYGQVDLINYQSAAGREVSLSYGGNSTTSAVAALIFDTNSVTPAAYFQNNDQHFEIELFVANAAGGTAQVRPSFVLNSVRYELFNFTLAAGAAANIRLILQPNSGGASCVGFYTANGATVAGSTVGHNAIIAIPFKDFSSKFQVWGETSAGQSLTIRKTRVVLWG